MTVTVTSYLSEQVKVVRPERTTSRTKAQIVAEAEATWLLPHLVGVLGCGPDCRCMKCYHRDAYVSYQELLARLSKGLKEAKHDGTPDTAGDADGDKLQAGAGADEAGVPWQG